MKNSNDTIGNRTRDLPVCNAVPQPLAPPRAPFAYRECGKSRGKPQDILSLRPRFEAATFQILSRSATHSTTFTVNMKMEKGGGDGGSNNIRPVEHENKISNQHSNHCPISDFPRGRQDRVAFCLSQNLHKTMPLFFPSLPTSEEQKRLFDDVYKVGDFDQK